MTAVSVSLTLNDEEKEFVQEALEEKQRTLLRELSHTDHLEFKTLLRKKTEVLESVFRRFEGHA